MAMMPATAVSQQVQRRLLRAFRKKSDALAVSIFLADAVVYLAATACAIHFSTSIAGALAGGVEGISIGMLFVVGHDACHGSFTSRRAWNALIGRLAFLPSLTPFSTWDLGHNRTHHVYTNLQPVDYVWAPLSKAEYDALPGWRRLLERAYRTPLGVGLYYAIEIWWKRLLFPGVRFIAPPKRIHFADSLLCAVYGLTIALAAGRFSWAGLWWGAAFPFAIWNWMMGATIFGHHTHAGVPWFDDAEEWRRAQPEIRCTVHLVFPRVVRILLHQIFDHTAHHLDVTIPLYRLHEAQTRIEQGGESILIERWTPAMFARHLRACKLYDFRRHQWQDYCGRPTSQVSLWRRREEKSCTTSRTDAEF